MTEVIGSYDAWLEDNGPAALVMRQPLMPAEGYDAVFFPPTFAAGDDFNGGYNIDAFADGNNVCLVDSVGSQANRIEPLFSRPPLTALIPQIAIKAGEKRISLLEAGHRAGDALIRCTELQPKFQEAFQSLLRGDAEPLARVAPTSIVFGAWDSRDTQAKLPRLVASTIRAFNVRPLRRSAQYVPATEYVNEGLLDEPADKRTKDLYAQRGFVHVPSSGVVGGVIATGGIRRDVTLHLAALRALRAGEDTTTVTLRRYVLGLAMVAFHAPATGYLRQGCTLVPDPETRPERLLIHADGKREAFDASDDALIAFASAAAAAFRVDSTPLEVSFDTARAKADVSTESEAGTTSRRRAKKVK